MTDQPASRPYVDAPVLPGLDEVAHWDDASARARLDRLRDQLPLPVPADARLSSGESNDVWDLGEHFLRVCWRADRDRVAREAALLAVLPAEVPHAPVRAHGRTDDLSWLICDRVPGEPLDRAVASMTTGGQQCLWRQAADILRSLHQWVPAPDVLARLRSRPTLTDTDPLSVWAADLLPLPLVRVGAHLELARQLPHVDVGLIDAVGERMADLADADPFASSGDAGSTAPNRIVHSDPSLSNWFVQDGRITALLDFEWARIGPPDLELVTPVYLAARGDSTAVSFLYGLRAGYPELFAAPDVDRRLWLCELGFFLRGVIWWPPNAPEATLDPSHHVHALRHLLDRPLPIPPLNRSA